MDDDLSFSLSLADDLRVHGYDVDTVSSATDAIEHILTKSYDVVITDMIVKSDDRSVPDGGVSLIHWLRFTLREGHPMALVPIIGISGATKFPGMKSILQVAQSLGANAAMEKPVSPSELVKTIEALTGGAKRTHASASDVPEQPG
ncbi:response regulator [uncultured Roseobacter sp.]|uniref:response regulator n=1 Tax=uncultured Roseobacter sp. TaxID=114847 RepID=UPI00261140F1|nr:response regulator [uncultured Roseobacter sp.]